MRRSIFNTYTVAAVGSNTPTTLARAATVPIRVLVNNVGTTLIFIAGETASVAPQPGTDTYRIAAGEQHVFVLAPQEAVYGIAAGAGGLMSVAISEAWPVT